MDCISLKNGPDVPWDAISLALRLEAQGFLLREDQGKLKLTGDPSKLSAEDRAAVTRWRDHLLAIIDYIASGRADLPTQ